MVAVELREFLTDDGVVAGARAGREFQVERGVVHLIHFDGHNFRELFDSVLHLHRLGRFVAEAFDEVLHLGDFSLLVFVGAELLFTAFMSEADVVVIAHLVVRDSSA